MHASKKIYGSVNANVPAPYPFVISAFAVLFIAFVFYGLNADFATLYEVKGYLNTELGISQVHASRAGVISQSFVENGQQVVKGAPLFKIDTTTDPIAFGTEQEILQKRMLRLQRQIAIKTQYLHSLTPLLAKHYLSLSTYQTLQEQLRDLESNQHQLRMDLLHHQQTEAYVIRAPITGSILGVQGHDGQKVRLSQVLLTILPEKSKLVVELYVPVAKSGFLQTGERMTLHYDAYPYQHFGVATAKIKTISHSILNDRDEVKPIHIGVPYYKVVAELDRQYIVLDGQKHPLQPGITCTAVIKGEHKKLWKWIFDPIHVTPL